MQRFNMVNMALAIIEGWLAFGVVVCVAGYYNLGWSQWPFGIVASMMMLVDAHRGGLPKISRAAR